MASGAGSQAAALWQALSPERWPVALADLPPGSALVGGAVRDALLGRLPARPDLDLVVPEEAVALTQRLAARRGGTCVVLDRERSIARLVVRGWTLDLARCAGGDLAADLARRDYTINAIALPLPGPGETAALVDPEGGVQDLAARSLRAISEANLLDDPLRLLRGLRLAAELCFTPTEQTWAWMRTHHGRIAQVAGERVLAELERLAAAPAGAGGLAAVVEAGLLAPWGGPPAGGGPQQTPSQALEGLTPEGAAERGLGRGEAAAALTLARLAAVLDGPAVARLHGSRRLQQRCRTLRHWLHRLESGGRRSLEALGEEERLALHRQLEEDLPALLLHLDPQEARRALLRWRDAADVLFHPRPPLDGHRLRHALALPAGPLLGELIEHLTRERAFGRLPPTDDPGGEFLTAAQRWLTHRGDERHG